MMTAHFSTVIDGAASPDRTLGFPAAAGWRGAHYHSWSN